MKKLMIISLLTLLTTACGDDEQSKSEISKEETVKTVSYWIDNQESLPEHITWCNESMDRKITPNCMNAIDAEAKIARAKIMGSDPHDYL